MREEKAIIHCCVERDVYEMLSRHCERTGQTKTTAIKRAIRAYCSPKPASPVKSDDGGPTGAGR